LTYFDVTSGNTNTGITCAPKCLTTVTTRNLPTVYCQSFQDIGLCSFIAATNIASINSYSLWTCDTNGVTITNPCVAPIWLGLTCSNGYASEFTLNSIAITGSLPSKLGMLSSLSKLSIGSCYSLIGNIFKLIFILINILLVLYLLILIVSIPTEFENLKLLASLELFSVSFTGK